MSFQNTSQGLQHSESHLKRCGYANNGHAFQSTLSHSHIANLMIGHSNSGPASLVFYDSLMTKGIINKGFNFYEEWLLPMK